MNTALVVGGGGREHALCWKLAQEGVRVTCAPGNAGIAEIAEISACPPESIVQTKRPDLVVIGPDAALAITDRLRSLGATVFGPTRSAARLETSKMFARRLCDQAGVPGPDWAVCVTMADVQAFVDTHPPPWVAKRDGLAAGKGVVVTDDHERLTAFAGAVIAQDKVVLMEEFLPGVEMSFFAISDGRRSIPFATAKDYKRAFDGDQGDNTGGMGAISPHPLATAELTSRIMQTIIEPVARTLRGQCDAFVGCLYAGLMLTQDGPKVVEFNARFGDPETQAILPRMKSSLFDLLLGCARGEMQNTATFLPKASATVVLASLGYPGEYRINTKIGLSRFGGGLLFHAGTRRTSREWRSTGGRCLAVTGLGDEADEARAAAYRGVQKIRWRHGFYRTDIGS